MSDFLLWLQWKLCYSIEHPTCTFLYYIKCCDPYDILEYRILIQHYYSVDSSLSLKKSFRGSGECYKKARRKLM